MKLNKVAMIFLTAGVLALSNIYASEQNISQYMKQIKIEIEPSAIKEGSVNIKYLNDKSVSRESLGLNIDFDEKNISEKLSLLLKKCGQDAKSIKESVAAAEKAKNRGGIEMLNSLIASIPDNALTLQNVSEAVNSTLYIFNEIERDNLLRDADRLKILSCTYKILRALGDNMSDAVYFEIKEQIKTAEGKSLYSKGETYTYVPLNSKRIALIYDRI